MEMENVLINNYWKNMFINFIEFEKCNQQLYVKLQFIFYAWFLFFIFVRFVMINSRQGFYSGVSFFFIVV